MPAPQAFKKHRNQLQRLPLALALILLLVGLMACGKAPQNQRVADDQADPLLVVSDDTVTDTKSDVPDQQENELLNQLMAPDDNSVAPADPEKPEHPHPHPNATPWPAPPPSYPMPNVPAPSTDVPSSNSPNRPATIPQQVPQTSNPKTEPAPKPEPLPNPTATPAKPSKPAPKTPQQEPVPEEPSHPATPTPSPTPKVSKVQTPIRGFWDDATKDGRQWTAFAINAVEQYGDDLMKSKPTDIAEFCPSYGSLDQHGRKNFWVKVISAIAAAESSYQPASTYTENFPDKSGSKVVSRGLLQLSMESANGYGCGIRKQTDLDDPQTNINCGVRILDRWISRDGVMTDSDEENWYGAARYWSVMRSTSKRLKTIQQLLKQTAICSNK